MEKSLKLQINNFGLARWNIAGKMPLTQEKRLDSNFSNNNDHSYLHKKFKKKASTISAFSGNSSKVDETRYKETNIANTANDNSISNGSISAAHPEIQKIKDRPDTNRYDVENNVQINFNETSISDVNNVQLSGQTSFTDEFSNKTENLENDFIRDAYNGTSGGRYICPYCKLSCAKPSVLQKHIRAHTNERPYPCVPCGFAFKTKSNLYKHQRSRTHTLRMQGADVPVTINDEDLSGGSESDTSMPPTSVSDTGSEPSIVRLETYRPNEFSSPELTNDSIISINNSSSNDNAKPKTIYKPKFRAALYKENDDKDKLRKSISQNADFLTEHISKIISDNEAIVDVIETPLQKKYGKIKQIAESKQFLDSTIELKREQSPLNLTKCNAENDNAFRKRSHSESFSQIDHHKHPLNPEGSIIKDLLLKTKGNGLIPVTGEIVDGPSFICPLCQIPYRSIENLEVHRAYYCKGFISNNTSGNNQTSKEVKILRPENIFVRSNSVNVRLPETSNNSFSRLSKSPPIRIKPDNLVITKSETSDVVAPLPSPGPLLGNTRLVDSRTPDLNRKSENFRINKHIASPKRRLDSRSDTFSPRSAENVSPRSDLYLQPKIRCLEASSATLRPLDDTQPHMRHNATSLQMFGGEVKIVDHMGSTTTLRIEPSKNQLSPILIQQNLSPSKLVNETEASSVVVRSGLHSGGTMVHNPPTPKEVIGTPQPKTPRIALQISTASGVSTLPNMHDITHFQFPPLSAITAYNPLTLPPLSPSSSPSGASTILHGGKLIPHVPGMPGPNTPGIFIASPKLQGNNMISNDSKPSQSPQEAVSQNSRVAIKNSRSPARPMFIENDKTNTFQDSLKIEMSPYTSSLPLIKIKNVDEPTILPKIFSANVVKSVVGRQEAAVKRNADGVSKTAILKENMNYPMHKLKSKEKSNVHLQSKPDIKPEGEIRNFNFESLITKAEIYNNQISNSLEIQMNANSQDTQLVSSQNERSETSYFQKNSTKSGSEERKPKFLRPSTLPLKPGTFTPKRHHGITPNANTMPLVSPETPRPAKAYGQLYLNGNAYTYLGLKCSTKVFYCTINRPQPTYVPNQHFLSMYSNWQLLSELTPDPLGLSASSAMSLYDSRHRPQNVAVSVIKQDLILTHSSQWNKNKDNKQSLLSLDSKKGEESKLQPSDNVPKKELTGGFESNEEYTYVRGRGRGRYVCSECGIRCKKPSMLKKHIRTHTDVRPYTCIHCAFSFKTKGNLTKHMKSKAHYKKCCELGINPNEGNDIDGGEMVQSGETDDETESDGDEGNEGETESSDTEVCKSRLPEHEAAHCLLSLGGARPATSATPGLITSARPCTYPYTPATAATAASAAAAAVAELAPPHTPGASTPLDCRDAENEPIDLSKSDVKLAPAVTEIPTARESSVLASLASNTAKLPQHQSQWANGEPMLHTYLTERALQDSKIKQSQLTGTLSKIRKIDVEKSIFEKETNLDCSTTTVSSTKTVVTSVVVSNTKDSCNSTAVNEIDTAKLVQTQKDEVQTAKNATNPLNLNAECKSVRPQSQSNAENAKHVVSEYLKQARINLIKSQEENVPAPTDNLKEECFKPIIEDNVNEECNISEPDSVKLPGLDHDPVARKVVIGVGGVAFKVTKGKEFDNSSYPPGRLMEDGRRVCDFCNKTFTKPSQLRLHLNIHYMERPFRCSVCAVSFRTRGHLQKHERSGSHHNKVSMTSTFGAATSFNPRPFRCSDCNIAFRIHGHLAKHLRSKMHVMRLECLFKLPFGTFTEIERAGVSLTDIDTTDCASSLASLQCLARKLHEKDPTKLEYREGGASAPPAGRDSSDDEDAALLDRTCDSEKDSEMKNIDSNENREKVT